MYGLGRRSLVSACGSVSKIRKVLPSAEVRCDDCKIFQVSVILIRRLGTAGGDDVCVINIGTVSLEQRSACCLPVRVAERFQRCVHERVYT